MDLKNKKIMLMKCTQIDRHGSLKARWRLSQVGCFLRRLAYGQDWQVSRHARPGGPSRSLDDKRMVLICKQKPSSHWWHKSNCMHQLPVWADPAHTSTTFIQVCLDWNGGIRGVDIGAHHVSVVRYSVSRVALVYYKPDTKARQSCRCSLLIVL